MFIVCNLCARAELHQQKQARKLCSAALKGKKKNVIKKEYLHSVKDKNSIFTERDEDMIF